MVNLVFGVCEKQVVLDKTLADLLGELCRELGRDREEQADDDALSTRWVVRYGMHFSEQKLGRNVAPSKRVSTTFITGGQSGKRPRVVRLVYGLFPLSETASRSQRHGGAEPDGATNEGVKRPTSSGVHL